MEAVLIETFSNDTFVEVIFTTEAVLIETLLNEALVDTWRVL